MISESHGPRRLGTHSLAACEGRTCCIHNPSDHHMKHWPKYWRNDLGIMERLCPHGIGHPDPDDAAYRLMRCLPGQEENEAARGIHSCDGCCQEGDESLVPV